MSHLLPATGLLICLCVAIAQEPTPTTKEPTSSVPVADLIAKLADRSFRVRAAAVKELIRRGEAVRDRVAESLKSSTDAEQKRLARHVLEEFDRQKLIELQGKLAFAEMQVVGLYQPGTQGGEVVVQVNASDKPIILVLTAYTTVNWKIEAAKDAQLVKVIIGGYHPQKVDGADVPVESYTYLPRQPGVARLRYFYAYRENDAMYQRMATMLRQLTNKEITAFQGSYNYTGTPFVIGRK
jgi:hypothetical protein